MPGRTLLSGRKVPGRFLLTLLLPALALLLPAARPAQAENPATDSDQLRELSLEDLMAVQVVYSASRYEQTLLEAPSSVSIITADEIEAYGYRELADILAGTRGIFTTNDRNYRYAGIRGFARPGDYNSRVLLLLDGHRLNDNIYDSAPIGGDFPLDVDLIERVEIVRGPASSIYGTSAFFGVINIVTKDGADLDGVRLSTAAGSFDTSGVRVDFGERSRHGIDLLASASGLHRGGQDLYFPEFDDPTTNQGLAQSSDREEIRRYFLEASYQGFRLEALTSQRNKRIPTGAWETIFNDPRTQTDDGYDLLTLEYSRPVEPGRLGFLGRLSHNTYEYVGDYVYDYGEEGDPYPVVNVDSASGRWWGGNLEVVKKFAAGHTILAGAEYRNNFRQDQWNLDAEEVYLDDARSSESWALFLEGDLSLRDDFRFNGGLRLDEGARTDARLSPRAALIWSPLQEAALKFLHGRAFRAPNAYELFYGDGGISQKGSPHLGSEEISTDEVVWEQEFGPRWGGLVSVYRYRIDRLINLVTDPEDELLVFENLGRVQAKGVEIELERSWRSGLQARWSYAYQDAKEPGGGGELSNSPSSVAKLQLRGRLLNERLGLATDIRYLSSRRTLAGRTAGDHVVANLTLSARLPGDRLSLTAGFYNLFDERYADPGSEEHLQDLITQDGRSWRLAITFQP